MYYALVMSAPRRMPPLRRRSCQQLFPAILASLATAPADPGPLRAATVSMYLENPR